MYIRVSALVIFVLALTVYLPFNALLPVTDPVESNYALTAKEMLESGDWMSPRIYGQYWFDKPVMIYWLIALSYKVLGINEFAARLPSAIFSAATVALAYRFGQIVYNSYHAGALGALVLATSLEFWLLSRMVITDAALIFFSSAAMVSFYLGLIGRGWWWQAAAYAFAGLAVLTKGPIGILMPGLIVFTFILISRRWELLRRLFLLPGLAILLMVVLPWYFYMYNAHGRMFVDTFLGLHNYLRATVSEHPKDNVFYYYFVLFPVSLLPWAGVALRAVYQALGKFRSLPVGFLAVWILTIIGFFTVMATKYPTYVFPAMFPAAILTGGYLEHLERVGNRKAWLWLTIPALLLFLLLGAAGKQLAPRGEWLLLYVLIAAASAAVLWLQTRGAVRRLPEAVAISVILISFVVIGQGFMTYAHSRSAKVIAQSLPAQGATVALYGDYATSAVYYTGYTIPRLVNSERELRDEGVWAGKYTMPTELISNYLNRTQGNVDAYLIVVNSDPKRFSQEKWSSEFMPVASQGKFVLYRRAVAQ